MPVLGVQREALIWYFQIKAFCVSAKLHFFFEYRQKLGGVGRGASKVRWSDGSMVVLEKRASEDDVWRFLIVWG